ncbi:MAG TPA: hypothetical protein DEQ84_01210 [Prevotellaceae bacterium]|nr:hypothetical protein [Prevotellaceae bacterium]
MLMPSRNHCVQDVVPAVGSEGFGCSGKSYGCQVCKFGNYTSARYVPEGGDTIFGKIFEYIEDFSELYDEIVCKRSFCIVNVLGN